MKTYESTVDAFQGVVLDTYSHSPLFSPGVFIRRRNPAQERQGKGGWWRSLVGGESYIQRL